LFFIMLILILILLVIYSATIIFNVARTIHFRRKIRVGDICRVYFGEIKFQALVLNVSDDIEIKVLNRVMLIPRELIYS
jgi:hypothetical protein